MKKLPALILSTGLMVQIGTAQTTGSGGDQGNGTYKNPILESSYPDNDVLRVGDTFYMMSSTCHFVPGMTKSMEGPWSQPKELTWANGQSINSTDPGGDVGFGHQAGLAGVWRR